MLICFSKFGRLISQGHWKNPERKKFVFVRCKECIDLGAVVGTCVRSFNDGVINRISEKQVLQICVNTKRYATSGRLNFDSAQARY